MIWFSVKWKKKKKKNLVAYYDVFGVEIPT